jgi:hypothetical protein
LTQQVGGRPKIRMIFANKCECESYKRSVDYPTAIEFANRHNIQLMEVSAKHGTNLDQAYNILIQLLKENIIPKQIHEFEIEEGMKKKRCGRSCPCCALSDCCTLL